MAPEIFYGEPFLGVPADVFALGVILFELFAGCPPFTMDGEFFYLWKYL